jgi:hypothetical protein
LTVIAQHRAFLLLPNDSVQAVANVLLQNHAGERELWVGALNQALQFAARPSQGNRGLSTRRSTGALPVTGLLDKPLKLVSFLGSALAGL